MVTRAYLSIFLVVGILMLNAQQINAQKKADRPNILLAIADDVSFPHMSAYGCTWINTPAFDRVAKNGLLFNHAYTPNAKCAPSRACILTGRNSWQLEQAANHFPHFPAKFKTFMEALKANGYHTGHTAKGFQPGDPGMVDGKPRELTGKAYNQAKTDPPTSEIGKIDYAANFELFLNDREEQEPFCFWFGSYEPHRAYEYGTGQRVGKKKPEEIDRVFGFWPDVDSVRNDMLDYAFELEYFDQQLAQMLKTLEEKGELDNTLVIVTADNGMPFPRVKGQAYELANHLPLAIMWGSKIKNPGRVIEDYISFIDFAPTLLEVAGVKEAESGMQPITGGSLTDIFYSKKSGLVDAARDHVLIGKERHDVGRPHDWGYPIRGLIKGDYLYLKNYKTDRWPSGNPETGYLNCDAGATKYYILTDRRQNGSSQYWDWNFGKRPEEELYRLDNDPDCIKNLAEEPAVASVKAAMQQQMEKELMAQKDPRVLGNGDIFDHYEYSQAKNRNFYYRYMSGELPGSSASWTSPLDFEVIPELKRGQDQDFRFFAETPPMGWNSYDAYHGAVTEQQFRGSVDVLAEKLLPHGWEYAVVDFCWSHPGPEGWNPDKDWTTFKLAQNRDGEGTLSPVLAMDEYGRLLPAVNRFPSSVKGKGFKALADYVHGKGMKFGIHIMRGIPRQAVEAKTPILGTNYTAADIAEPFDTCRWNNHMYGVDAAKPGAQEYYNSLFKLYAEWGVDYIKADDMTVPVYHKGEIEMMRKAIDQCGRPMVLSLSCGETPIPMANHLEQNANLWRISIDFWDNWDDVHRMFDLLNSWSPFIGEGTWPDADMIPIGKLCLSGYPDAHDNPDSKHREHESFLNPDEQQTLMSLWCMARSPLMWGGDPLSSSQETFDLLSNSEVLEIVQNSTNNHQVYQHYNGEKVADRIWVADIPGTEDHYLAFFNLTDEPMQVRFDFEWEGWRGQYFIRDLWQHKDLGTFEHIFTREIRPHASAVYRVSRG